MAQGSQGSSSEAVRDHTQKVNTFQDVLARYSYLIDLVLDPHIGISALQNAKADAALKDALSIYSLAVLANEVQSLRGQAGTAIRGLVGAYLHARSIEIEFIDPYSQIPFEDEMDFDEVDLSSITDEEAGQVGQAGFSMAGPSGISSAGGFVSGGASAVALGNAGFIGAQFQGQTLFTGQRMTGGPQGVVGLQGAAGKTDPVTGIQNDFGRGSPTGTGAGVGTGTSSPGSAPGQGDQSP